MSAAGNCCTARVQCIVAGPDTTTPSTHRGAVRQVVSRHDETIERGPAEIC